MWQLNKKHWRWVVNILLFHLLAAIATSNLRRVVRPILLFLVIPGGKLGFRNFEIPAGLLLNLCSGERLFYDVALFCTKLSHMVLSSLTQFLGRWMHIKEVVVHWCRYKGGETKHPTTILNASTWKNVAHAKVRSSSTKIQGKCNPCRKLHHTNLFGRSLFRSADSNLRWVWAEMCLKWKHTGGRQGPLGKRQMQNRETTQTWNVFLAQIRIHASSSMCASLCCLC